MRGFLSLQPILVPLSLLMSALLAYPAWEHHALRETSPLFSASAAVERWARGKAHARGCLARTIDLEILSEHGENDQGGPASGPWFGTLRCNQPRIYTRMAVLLLAPLVVINLVVLGLRMHRR